MAGARPGESIRGLWKGLDLCSRTSRVLARPRLSVLFNASVDETDARNKQGYDSRAELSDPAVHACADVPVPDHRISLTCLSAIRAIRPQCLGQKHDDRAMQREDRFDEMERVCSQVANNAREPGLILQFERVQSRNSHGGPRAAGPAVPPRPARAEGR